MRLRLPVNSLTYIILVLHLLVPMLDSVVCADCMGNAPFQGETTIDYLQAPHDDVIYTSHDGTQSKTPGERNAKSFCLICFNVLMGVEVSFPNLHIAVSQHDGPHAVTALSDLHYSIDKPPQNNLV